MQLAASIRERVTLLSDLHSSLCHLHSFSGEDERMRWRWRLHQLQRQHNLEQQDAQITSLLAAIENQISALPIESDGRFSRTQASTATVAVDEVRLTVEDLDDQRYFDSETPRRRGSIPIMENEVLATMEETRRGGWGRLSRFARAASGHTLGALTRSNVRDRGRSVPLTRMSMRELNAEVRDDGDDMSLAVAASSRAPESVAAEEERDLSSSLTAYRRQESNSLSHSVPSLLRSMASYLGLSMEETFLCQICYDYAPMKTSYALSVCGHLFCEACLRNYLEFKIKEGQVYPKCFFEISEDKTACNAKIAVDDIQSLVSDGVWQKYNKFKFNKEHELARQCPYCDHSQLCAGSDHPECVCEACNREFCFVHSSAHQGHSCAEYDKKMIAVEKLNNALISKISKPCPGCQNNVEKTGGCNQMKCVVCTTSFCWICLKVIDDTVFPEHFQWWNVRGCAGNQMADIEGQGSTQKGVGIVMRIIFFVIFGPPAFVMAVVFSVLCCCFLPCTAHARLTFRQAFTTCFCVSGYILLAPIVLALGLAALGVFIGGAAAGAAVLVCVSPFVAVLLCFGRDPRLSTSSQRSSSRRSGVGETATARDFEDTNDQSPSDQTFFRVST
ncbi:IBR domain-containing protein [Phytophthora infestans]|uniref:RBR-type E3 ubiquitin transferase n=1 Tax=Phytophthora infestans TaxID=4787 RepID=A0A8S9UVA5_PHYIN|nr:IBR domain-containing protein [Phytophthora infestans]